jgi:hypothetical protein
MNKPRSITRYNQRIPDMRARTSSSPRAAWLTSFLLAAVLVPSSLCALPLEDTARQLGHKIAAATGPGEFLVTVVNRSSLDDESAGEARGALEAELQRAGVHAAKAEPAMGTIEVVLSESVREYVWTARITVGSEEKKVALVSLPLPLPQTGTAFAAALPVVLRTTLLFTQERPLLDAALVDMPEGPRLVALEDDMVAIYRRQNQNQTQNQNQGANLAGPWQLEAQLAIAHARAFPRDLRGRLLLRRDHLFDVYLPGMFCRSNSSTTAPLALTCNNSDGQTSGALNYDALSYDALTYDDPWPLTPEEGSVRAFFAASRNFFTGALSPAIGKVSNVPAFYSAAALPRSGSTIWALAAVDGSVHVVDGMADQVTPSVKWGSDLAAVHSSCGAGAQLLVTESGAAERDNLRAFEIPERDPVAVSSAVEFDGQITALWTESSGGGAVAIVQRKDTGWYEAYRVSITCGN